MRSLSELSIRRGLRVGARESLRQVQILDERLVDEALLELMLENLRRTRFVSRGLSGAVATDRLLSQLQQPILIMLARDDIHRQFGLREALRTIAQNSSHAQVCLVERARHWLQYERAAVCNALLLDFVR